MKKFLSILLIIITLLSISGCKNYMQEKYVLKAQIIDNGEKIEVNVIESDYAFGTYLVITGPTTIFIDQDGKIISKNQLTKGSVVEITYGGQVMMSYPPQSVAGVIKIIEN